MVFNIYLNTQYRNSTGFLSPAVSFETRQDNIIPTNTSFDLSVDRWFIEGAYVPIFQIPSVECYFKVGNITSPITWVSSDDPYNGNFLYTMEEFLLPINNALAVFNVGLSASFSNGRFSLAYTGTNPIDLYFDMKMGAYLNFDNMKISSDFMDMWKLSLSGTSTITQSATSLDILSPIVRISIESNDIPCVPEMLPSQAGQDLSSKNTSNIISDYKYTQTDTANVKTMLYNASGNHRYQSLINGMTNFKSCRIQYFMFDYSNNKYPILLINGGMVESKLLFSSKDHDF